MSHVPTVLKSDRSVFDKMLPVDDNGVKGQCQRYLESVLRFLTQTHMVFLTEVFPILYNDCQYGISGKGKGQTYIEPGCLVSNTNSSYFFIFDTMFVQRFRIVSIAFE